MAKTPEAKKNGESTPMAPDSPEFQRVVKETLFSGDNPRPRHTRDNPPTPKKGENWCRAIFTELKTINRVTLADISLDGVRKEGVVTIDISAEGVLTYNFPESVSPEDGHFWDMIEMSREGFAERGVDIGTIPTGEEVQERIHAEFGVWKNGCFPVNERIHTTTGYGTAALATDAVTHFRDTIIPLMVSRGESSPDEADKHTSQMNELIGLIEKHESRIEYVKPGVDGFGTDQWREVVRQIRVCEVAEKIESDDLTMAAAVYDYVGDRKGMLEGVEQAIRDKVITRKAARWFMKDVRREARKISPGLVSRKVNEIGNFLSR